ncbi:MAG: nuclear transport factor 2 family protein [Polyangiaceae bacterium]
MSLGAPNMSSPVQVAVDRYIRAVCKSDREERIALFEACLAEDVRMVTRSREIRGRAQLTEEVNRFLADPQLLRVRVTSSVDVGKTTFRYRAVADFVNGTSAEAFDAGEIDETGRIVLILTFAGPLGEATDESVHSNPTHSEKP